MPDSKIIHNTLHRCRNNCLSRHLVIIQHSMSRTQPPPGNPSNLSSTWHEPGSLVLPPALSIFQGQRPITPSRSGRKATPALGLSFISSSQEGVTVASLPQSQASDVARSSHHLEERSLSAACTQGHISVKGVCPLVSLRHLISDQHMAGGPRATTLDSGCGGERGIITEASRTNDPLVSPFVIIPDVIGTYSTM